MSATKTIARHYDTLDGPERFVACIEAMARGDHAEDKRLDDGCPRRVCEVDDPEYRSRMSVSFTVSSLVCASIQRDLDVIRTIEVVRDVAKVLRELGAGVAEDAFVAGWIAAGGSDEGGEAADAELERARERGRLVIDVAARTVSRGVGKRRAASILGAWEGYGRFARECCGVEPEVLAKAWRLLDGDPTPEVLKLYPKAVADAEAADGWYASLGGSWRRRFDGGRPDGHAERSAGVAGTTAGRRGGVHAGSATR
ncbi:MAG TPA: hypothetical protein VF796_14490 [Humisphaera sp.]